MILFASVVVLLATAAAFVVYEIIIFKSQRVQGLSTLAAVVADNSRFSLSIDDKSSAVEVLAALRAEPDLQVAVLYDANRNFFASYPATAPAELLPRRLQREGHEFTRGALILFEPVTQEGKIVGTLYMRLSLRALYSRFWNYAGIVAAVLLAAFAGAFVLSTLLSRSALSRC